MGVATISRGLVDIGGSGLSFRIFLSCERLSAQFSALLQKYLHPAFGCFQFRATRHRELHPFFEKSKCLVKRQVALFQLLNDLFQPLQAIFKFGQAVSSCLCVLGASQRFQNVYC